MKKMKKDHLRIGLHYSDSMLLVFKVLIHVTVHALESRLYYDGYKIIQGFNL